MKYTYSKLLISTLLLPILLGCQKDEELIMKFTKSYTLSSAYSNEKYNLQILYPANYDSSKAYHTVYLLDGDWFFNELFEFVRTDYPNDIVLVGIGYKDLNKRNSDFTYPTNNLLENSGNANLYIQHLIYELIPYIEDSLAINTTQKTLAGHSLGGYFGLYLLFQNELPNPFNNIISASPSLFWDDAFLLDLEEQFNSVNDTMNVNLYTTMGDSEGVTMNTLFNSLNERIKSRNYEGLIFNYERFENTTHNNNPIQSFEEGISRLEN
jgi:predicted alpha/beta superfamily hydrolase